MKVLVLSKAMAAKNRNGMIADDVAADDLDVDEMLPPHEIVAQGRFGQGRDVAAAREVTN